MIDGHPTGGGVDVKQGGKGMHALRLASLRPFISYGLTSFLITLVTYHKRGKRKAGCDWQGRGRSDAHWV